MKHFDMIIIGGGMVGASLACALRDTHLKIALIDAVSLPIPEDPRLIALNYNSYCFFEKIGLWSELLIHASAIHQVHVSHRGHFGTTVITSKELQLDALGYVIPAIHINAALYKKLQNSDDITLIQPACLTSIENTVITIETTSGTETLNGNIIVGADGNHSTVRRLLDIPTEQIDYQQSALVTTTELKRPHFDIAYERFQQSGAIAMLPLLNQRVATIWTDSSDKIMRLMQLSDEEFLQTLQKQFGYRLGRLQAIHKRHVFPLHAIRAAQQIKQSSVLIGNAAHALHPIAAQGFNLALSEIAMLADCITHANPLCVFEHAIQTQQNNSFRLSHYLTPLFSTDFFPVQISRQLGMLGLNLCLPAKKYFAKHAMGLKSA